MSAGVRLAAFSLALAAVFAAAALAGAALDPKVKTESHEEETMSGHRTPAEESSEGGHDGHDGGSSSAALPGLAVSQAGYGLEIERTIFDSSADARLAFSIVDGDGAIVSDFDVEHERKLHLIVVGRDFQNFQHLHPEQRADGSWVAEADLSAPGTYRAFADFSTSGQSLTLGADLFVAGDFKPKPLPAVATTADVGDGYEVGIESGEPTIGAATPVEFTVRRDGRELDSVEPYLGADGHMVALRQHDLAFLHTHPEGDSGGPGPISFQVEYPSAGHYRLFLQFKHQGQVRTAAFTQEVGHGEH